MVVIRSLITPSCGKGSMGQLFLPISLPITTARPALEIFSIAGKRAFQKDGIRSMLLAFGWGDGGGGPTRDHLEFLSRA